MDVTVGSDRQPARVPSPFCQKHGSTGVGCWKAWGCVCKSARSMEMGGMVSKGSVIELVRMWSTVGGLHDKLINHTAKDPLVGELLCEPWAEVARSANVSDHSDGAGMLVANSKAACITSAIATPTGIKRPLWPQVWFNDGKTSQSTRREFQDHWMNSTAGGLRRPALYFKVNPQA
eukprot:6475272-Amphidinium_carterae.1